MKIMCSFFVQSDEHHPSTAAVYVVGSIGAVACNLSVMNQCSNKTILNVQ